MPVKQGERCGGDRMKRIRLTGTSYWYRFIFIIHTYICTDSVTDEKTLTQSKVFERTRLRVAQMAPGATSSP